MLKRSARLRWGLLSVLCPALLCPTLLLACEVSSRFHDYSRAFPARLDEGDLRLEATRKGIRFQNATAMVVGGGRAFVTEQRGRLYSFPLDGSEREATLVLDLSEHTQWGSDGGLLALALHPGFAEPDSPGHGQLFVYYLYRDEPAPAEDVDVNLDTLARLSRFTIPEGELAADPDSELILIEQEDRHIWHQGGGMFFHPRDGFLYLGIGDEGSTRCRFDNCQHLDRSLYGGVFRIDVDERGGEISHPIVRQPKAGTTAHYYIPDDNPFVGEPDVLEEFYALGLRNPHRMTHDPVDGFAWIGDVGHLQQEEIDILAPGANYQWDLMEGLVAATHESKSGRLELGEWTDPLWAADQSEVKVMIGGYVYRGSALPALYGAFVFADHVRGNLWALHYDIDAGRPAVRDVELLLETGFTKRDDGITSFGRDADGELYVLTMGEAPVRKLAPSAPAQRPLPRRLSATGLFEELRSKLPAPDLVPYDVNVPLWSDGAVKRRFVRLPEAESAEVDERGDIRFPAGTLFVKHFEIALDERRPDRLTPLETRVLVFGEEGLYGVTYAWNEDGSDADLLLQREQRALERIDAQGDSYTQSYTFPSPGDCLQCHDREGAQALGFKWSQLDGQGQWARLARQGVFARVPETGAYPRLRALDDAASLETRVRSYLDANCSHCHGSRELDGARWDARFSSELSEQRLVGAPSVGRGSPPGTVLVEPGAPERSLLLQRVMALEPRQRMPPLATARVDEAFIEVLRAWIAELGEGDAVDDRADGDD